MNKSHGILVAEDNADKFGGGGGGSPNFEWFFDGPSIFRNRKSDFSAEAVLKMLPTCGGVDL